jgi:hypothetical protein
MAHPKLGEKHVSIRAKAGTAYSQWVRLTGTLHCKERATLYALVATVATFFI